MINFQQIFDSLVYAFQAHTLPAAGLTILFVLLLIWRPKAILKVIAILITVGILLYIMAMIFDALNLGFSEKGKMFRKEP